MRRKRSCLCNGGPAPNLRWVIALTGVLLLVLPFVGCTSHAQRRVEAGQRWNHVRARVKYQLALEQFEREDVTGAVETVNEAIAADPESADQFLLLTRCYLEQGKYVSARNAAEQALRCAPDAAEIAYTLGVISERTEDLEVALSHYRRARLRAPGVADYVVAEAECLTAMGRHEEAVALVSANIGRFDSDGTLELLLAQISLLIGDEDSALDNLGLAIERAGCRAGCLEGLGECSALIEEYGRLLSKAGRHAEAVALLRPHVESGTDAPASSVVNALCVSYLATGGAAEAKRLLRKEVDRHPDNAGSWMLLARASMTADDWTTARRCADRLERLVPRNSQAYLLRGFVCWKQGDLQAALASLQRAIEIDSSDPLAHCIMGQVLEDAGRSPAVARTHYERALHIDPQFAWARRLMGLSGTRPTESSTVGTGRDSLGNQYYGVESPRARYDDRGFELLRSARPDWTRDQWDQAIREAREAKRRRLQTAG